MPSYFKEMAVLLDEDAFEPPLEKVAVSFVPFVEKLGIDTVQLPHAKGEVAIGCFDQKMIYGTGVFYAKWTGHGESVAWLFQNVNTKDLTL